MHLGTLGNCNGLEGLVGTSRLINRLQVVDTTLIIMKETCRRSYELDQPRVVNPGLRFKTLYLGTIG